MEEETTKLIKTSKITETVKWYLSEDKKDKDEEILCRIVKWDDNIPTDIRYKHYTVDSNNEDNTKIISHPRGLVTYHIYDAALYYKILKYFNVNDLYPFSFGDTLDEFIDFKLGKKKRSVSEWHSPQGVIGIYRRRYSYKKGKIEFYIDSNKDLFDKFVAFALKFKPDIYDLYKVL